jgi:hypothetical protein
LGVAEVVFDDVEVGVAFAGEGGGGAVAGEDFGVVGEEEDAAEGLLEGGFIAVGEVVAADAAGHEKVAGEEGGMFGGVEDAVAGAVAGGVEDGEGEGAEVDFATVLEEGVGVARGDGVGELVELAAGVFKFGGVELVDEDLGVGEGLGDDGVVGDMVPVAVGEEEVLDVEAVLAGEGEEGGGGGFGGVDEGGGFGGFVDDEVGVGFGEAAGVEEDFHGDP